MEQKKKKKIDPLMERVESTNDTQRLHRYTSQARTS